MMAYLIPAARQYHFQQKCERNHHHHFTITHTFRWTNAPVENTLFFHFSHRFDDLLLFPRRQPLDVKRLPDGPVYSFSFPRSLFTPISLNYRAVVLRGRRSRRRLL